MTPRLNAWSSLLSVVLFGMSIFFLCRNEYGLAIYLLLAARFTEERSDL